MQSFRLSADQAKFHQICTLFGFLKYIKFWLRSTDELCLMTLKTDAKFEEKLICYFKKGTFKKYVRSRFLSFDPLLSPSSSLFVFAHPPSPSHSLKVRSFSLELTLFPSISILVKFREKKLMMSTSILG